jgi:hypothetical protein
MAIIQPSGNAAIAANLPATSQYQAFFRAICAALKELQNATSNETAGALIGLNSITISTSDGTSRITLAGDTTAPGSCWYYGTDASGSRGWYSVYSVHEAGEGLVKLIDGYAILGEIDSASELPATGIVGTAYDVDGSYYGWTGSEWDLIDVDGVVGYRLDEVPDTQAGALLAITRDKYGRVTGTRDATITGTEGRVVVTSGDAVAGLPVIDLAELGDTADGAALLKITRDTYGRITATAAATSDDLAEGSANLYHTDQRVYQALTQQIIAGENISIEHNTDAQTLTVSSTGGGGSSGATIPVTAGEYLTAGKYCYIASDGLAYIADNTDADKAATCFVAAAIAAGASGDAMTAGLNEHLTDLTPGTLYALSASGDVVPASSLPAVSGTLLQLLGTALSATALSSSIQPAILRG